MRLSQLPMLVCAGLAALVMTGCGGAASGPPVAPAGPAARLGKPGWWREAPAGARAGVYVAQANGAFQGLVFGYGRHNDRNLPPACSIGNISLAQSQIAVGPGGDLYVPDFSNATIDVFAPHCGKLLGTVTDPGGADLAIAVAGSKFYVGGKEHVSICTLQGCTNDLSDASIFQITSLATDRSGNVWAAYYNQNDGPSLVVWPGGTMPGHVVSGYVNPNAPGDILFDRRDTLISIESTFPFAFVYRCNVGRAACKNTKTIDFLAGSDFGSLNAKNTDIQISDYAENAVDVYAYPSFKYKYSYSDGLNAGYSVEGIAQTI